MPLLLTTKEWIDDILSDEGVQGRLDDDGSGNLTPDDVARIERFITRASLEVGMTLRSRYRDSEWQGSNPPTDTPEAVQYMVAIKAARAIFGRRGLPSYEELSRAHEMVEQWLADIKSGNLSLVGVNDYPTVDFEPFVSNFTIDGRFRASKVRVVQQTSIGTADRRKNLELRFFGLFE